MRFLLFILISFFSEISSAFDVGIGFYKPDEKVQDVNGKETSDPFSPYLNIGHDFNIGSELKFSPKLGYIKHNVKSNDHYGPYKMETIYLLYDFKGFLVQSSELYYRFGLGTFAKQIKGSGGSVTVPNGAGTATAYRPGKGKRSYSGTLNLGLEWNIGKGAGTVSHYSLLLEMVVFELLEKDRRYLAFLMGTQFAF